MTMWASNLDTKIQKKYSFTKLDDKFHETFLQSSIIFPNIVYAYSASVRLDVNICQSDKFC